MPAVLSTLLATTLAAGGLAVAVHPRIGTPINPGTSGSFSVPRVPNPGYVRHGPIALAKTYRKFGVPLNSDLQGAVDSILAALGLDKRSTGSVAAVPAQYDTEYLCPVQIGTPAQTLNLDFDTGSSDLWVFSSETAKSSVNGQTVYTPSKSSTSKKLSGATWSITYGDGSSSSGDVYTDKVTVGGLAVSGQAVEAAQKVSDQFTEESDLDGLLGLAFSSINTVTPTQQKTFFDNAKSSLDSPLFTVDFHHATTGKYNFGYIDKTAYNGSITYTDVDSSQGFWSWTSSGYGVGTTTLSKTTITGIADTGTTLLLLPKAVVTAYYKKVTGAKYDNTQGGYTFSCSATLPSFTFGVEGSKITVPGSYINFAPTDDTGKTCFGGIQDDSDIGFAIFGDVALKAAFVVFDGGNEQLGWASKKLN